MGFTEIFVATHDEALKRAAALDGGAAAAPGAVRIAEITDFEVEQLGDLAGTAVHAGGADYELPWWMWPAIPCWRCPRPWSVPSPNC